MQLTFCSSAVCQPPAKDTQTAAILVEAGSAPPPRCPGASCFSRAALVLTLFTRHRDGGGVCKHLKKDTKSETQTVGIKRILKKRENLFYFTPSAADVT